LLGSTLFSPAFEESISFLFGTVRIGFPPAFLALTLEGDTLSFCGDFVTVAVPAVRFSFYSALDFFKDVLFLSPTAYFCTFASLLVVSFATSVRGLSRFRYFVLAAVFSYLLLCRVCSCLVGFLIPSFS